MPAYMTVEFRYKKSGLKPDTVEHFCEELVQCGLMFTGGYWGCEEDSYENIIRWNQERLEQNFELQYDESHDYDYKQMCFRFGTFSEARLYIVNEEVSDFFSFNLIIPEEEVVETFESGMSDLKEEDMAMVKQLADEMWDEEGMDSIRFFGETVFEEIVYRQVM